MGEPDHRRRHRAARAPQPRADARRRRADPAEPLGLVARPRARGRDRPRRAVGERRPHLARAPVPVAAPGAQAAPAAGLCAHRAPVRVPAVHRPGVDGAGRARHDQAQVLVVHPAPRVRAPRGRADPLGPCSRRDRAGARRRRPHARGADRAVRRAPSRGDRGHAARRRRAARAPRGRHGDVRRQPERQLHEHLPGRLRVLRVRPGQALARRLPRRGGLVRGEDPRRRRVRRHRDLHAGRHPSRLHARALRPLAAAREGGGAPAPPARVLADGGALHVRALGQAARGGVRVPARLRPRLDARHGGRGAPRRRAAADLARTSCPWTAGWRSSRPRTAAACARR